MARRPCSSRNTHVHHYGSTEDDGLEQVVRPQGLSGLRQNNNGSKTSGSDGKDAKA